MRPPRIIFYQRTAIGCAILCACVAPAARQSSFQDELLLPSVTITSDVAHWRVIASARIDPLMPMPTGLRKAAVTALALSRSGAAPLTPPDIYLLRQVTSSVTGLATFSVRGTENPDVPESPATFWSGYHEMPQSPFTPEGDLTIEQFALWIDPEALAAELDPSFIGIINGAHIQSWVVQSHSAGGQYIENTNVSGVEVTGLYRISQGSNVKTGFVAATGGGHLRFVFANGGLPGGEPVPFVKLELAAWDPDRSQLVEIRPVQIRNNLSPDGGLWVVVDGIPSNGSIGAILCFTTSQPDDCDRAPNGHALLHPLTEVF